MYQKLDNLAIIWTYPNSSWQSNYFVTLQTSTSDKIVCGDESSHVIDIGLMSTNSSRIINYCPELVIKYISLFIVIQQLRPTIFTITKN